jgi:TatD DNase family protein
MIFYDTHTHLYLEEFSEDRNDAIKRARKNGVEKFFLPNIDSTSVDGMLQMEKDFPNVCYPMMGLHPCSVKKDFHEQMDFVEQLLKARHFYAIGEIGIDLFWDKTFENEQKEVFRQQIRLAKHYQLPIVVHLRNAFNEVFEIVSEEQDGSLTGIFHCFSGTVEEAYQVINLGGFKLGIGGVVTFKNAGLDKVLKEVELSHLVLETDSPYLAPVPYRGKRNESAYIINIAEKLAELYNVPVAEIAKVTTENARSIFKI